MTLRNRQRGAVGILVVAGLVVLLAMAGLALDSSHAMLNKTRLQNAVDAAALSGAKVLDLTDGDTGAARTAAETIFGVNGSSLGNNEMGQAYPELVRGQALISEVLEREETQFRKTLEKGLRLLDEATGEMGEGAELDGETAFKLYDTYGFPYDLTEDALRALGIGVDRAGCGWRGDSLWVRNCRE